MNGHCLKQTPAKLPASAILEGVAVTMSQVFSPELSDLELVQLCQVRGARDDRPFQELFRRYYTLVWRVCYSFTRNAQDAEDLTQEVFFKVYRSLPQFEGRSSFKTWIYRIAANTSQNELRRRSRRPLVAEADVEMMAEYLPAAVTTESEWQTRSQREKLARALVTLQPEVYQILYLKDIEQRSYREIADLLDIGLSAAKMRAQRARLALQVAYRQLQGEE